MPLNVKELLSFHAIVIPVLFTLAFSSCGKIGDPLPSDIFKPQAMRTVKAQAEQKSNSENIKSKVAEINFQEKD